MSDQETTSGVQELIDRLSQEGVAEGQRQAEKIVTNAQAQSGRVLLESARRQASEILEQARPQADEMKSAGEEALRLGGPRHDARFQRQDPRRLSKSLAGIGTS